MSEDTYNTTELMRLLECEDYDGRYRVMLEFTRKVAVPMLGSEANMRDTINGSWAYGKNKKYRTSKNAVESLTEIARPFLHLCSECCITVWNGSCGTNIYLKKEQTMFALKFNGYPVFL